MRVILDRNAASLTAAERRAMWEHLATPDARPGRARDRALAGMAAGLATAVALMVVVRGWSPPLIDEAAPPTRIESPTAGAPPAHTWERTAPAKAPAHSKPVERVARAMTRAAVAPKIAEAPPIVVAGAPPAAPVAPMQPGTGVMTGRIVDPSGQAVPYANVSILGGPRLGALTDENGNFNIPAVPAGSWQIQAAPVGFDRQVLTVQVDSGQTATVTFTVAEPKVVKQIEEIEVQARRGVDTKSSTTKQTISGEKLKPLPVDNLKAAIGAKAGVVAQNGELHYRGGRAGEIKFQYDGPEVAPGAAANLKTGPLDVMSAPQSPPAAAAPAPAMPPVFPTTGGTRLPNDEPFDSMFFKSYGVNPFIPTDEDPLSTFAVDVDAASYTIARRYLTLGYLPPADAVRVEEFVNFFRQGYPRFEHDDFRILVDGAPSPFRPGYHLLRVGLKGREIAERDRKPAQLTFVIDVSGSMAREDRLELVKRALRALVGQLRRDDQVGLVVFGTEGRVLLEPAPLGDDRRNDSRDVAGHQDVEPAGWGAGRRRLLEAIDQLAPEGSTNTEDGLRLGYAMARRAFRRGAINRIVLCSDGVANVGNTGPEAILREVRGDKDRGISLTTIGFGMGNYNDVLMERLADEGDGNHYYVDDFDEARRVFVENLTGTLQTIAKDAKVQVEFDSTRVLRYRLLGFENRDVADRDFRNDRVDAGEIGAGHEVTALYEVKLAPRVRRGTLATVRLRWAVPGNDAGSAPVVREIAQDVDVASLEPRFDDASPRFRLDAAVAQCAEILRGSYWAKEVSFATVVSVARRAAGQLADVSSAEFVTLAERAAGLAQKAKPSSPPGR